MSLPRFSRSLYRDFVTAFRERRLDDSTEPKIAGAPETPRPVSGKRREYLREYVRWLWPHRFAVAVFFLLALLAAGLEMIEPLFMRFIIDRVLLNTGLDAASRLSPAAPGRRAFFVGGHPRPNLFGVLKDYRQRLLNVRVMLSLRRSLFDRLLHLPLPKLWDMKTGGILSRLTGDVDTTTGLLQMAVVSPALSLIRLLIAVGVLLALNWRLALTALAIIPGVDADELRRSRGAIRPIYRSVRKDVGADRRPRRRDVLRASASSARSGARCASCSTTCSGATPCCARSCSRIAASWCSGRPGACCSAAVNVVIVWYGGYLNIVGRASIGDIMAFQWYTFLLLNPVWNIVNSFSELQRSLAAMERVFEVLGDGGRQAGPARTRATRRAVVHEIRVRERRVRIPRGPARSCATSTSSCPAGRSSRWSAGAAPGKTTVTDLVARFHDPTRGRILLNGTDIRDFRLAHVPRPAGDRAAGRVPVRRLGARQHRLRPARRHGRRGRGRRPPRQRARVHRAGCPSGTRRSSASAA